MVTWRIITTGGMFAAVWMFTGQLMIAAGAASIEAIIKMVFYYIHERVWNKIEWGR